ncbi:MAG: hypothetical protein B1H08_06505 [Candidatus Omnitrophica bacterium 4484_171]|nr:MAG: hypothetical protein B1H08_06505 [Candidatus Omnitrophica bacterium 4484_171]
MINISQLSTVLDRFSRRERIIFYASVVFVALALIDRLLVSPALDKIASLESNITDKKEIIQKDLHFIYLKKGIEKEASSYAGYFKKEASYDEGMNAFLKLIEDIARRSSIDLLNIRPAGVKAEKGIVKYYVDLNCRGRMEQIILFIYRIESAKKILTIDKVTISAQEEGSSVAQCRLTVSGLSIP